MDIGKIIAHKAAQSAVTTSSVGLATGALAGIALLGAALWHNHKRKRSVARKPFDINDYLGLSDTDEEDGEWEIGLFDTDEECEKDED